MAIKGRLKIHKLNDRPVSIKTTHFDKKCPIFRIYIRRFWVKFESGIELKTYMV